MPREPTWDECHDCQACAKLAGIDEAPRCPRCGHHRSEHARASPKREAPKIVARPLEAYTGRADA